MKIIYLLGALGWFSMFGAMFFGIEPPRFFVFTAFFLSGIGSLMIFLEKFDE